MNIHIDPEQEYKMMMQFFQGGGEVEGMPEEMLRTRKLWKRADQLIRRYPYYDNEKIAKQLLADFPEYNLSLSSAKRHVTSAKKYFDFVETETPATHRRILTTLLYKQIEKLNIYQANNPVNAAKIINQLAQTIAGINHLYEKDKEEEKELEEPIIVLSEKDFDDMNIKVLPEKELYKLIDKITEAVDLNPEERQKMIDKDVRGIL